MKTLPQAFETFLQKLELTEPERTKASDQHRYMREQLQQRLSVDDNFLTGSYARYTAIRPLNDIDIFVVLRTPSMRDRPHQYLDLIKRTLEGIYSGKTSQPRPRSINIEFTGTGIAYDVVPAFLVMDGVYEIPDADASRWIRTNPKIHMQRSTQANEAANKKLKPLIKAVKHANNKHGKLARSFQLDVLAWGILTRDPGPYMDGLCQLLAKLGDQITLDCPDPAGLGPSINPSADKCRKAQAWLRDMSRLAEDARDLAGRGKLGEAHAKMYELFGDPWPEKGSSSKPAAGFVGASGAVDDSRSRFG
jgi:predicted nucleotidyltransferase